MDTLANSPSAAAASVEGEDAGAPLRPSASGFADDGEVRRGAYLVFPALGAGFLVCLLVYLALNVPASWFPGDTSSTLRTADMTVVRGAGGIVGDELLVTGIDSSGLALVSVASNLRAKDFSAIAWVARDVPEDAAIDIIWRTDADPQRINSVSGRVIAGRLKPVVVANDNAWTGRVTGLALVIRAQLTAPIRIRGVVARPMGAIDLVRDRAQEWLTLESWTGSSINTLVGGADIQDLPLPPLTAAAFAVGVALLIVVRRWRPRAVPALTPTLLLALFALAWLVLDARWTWNLIRQEAATIRDYGGKSLAETQRIAEDAPLFAFVERARSLMPGAPARVFVAADEPYYRLRAIYHLYPHTAFASRGAGNLPPGTVLRANDWVLVYGARGVAYEPGASELRWGADRVAVELKLSGPGAALFLVR